MSETKNLGQDTLASIGDIPATNKWLIVGNDSFTLPAQPPSGNIYASGGIDINPSSQVKTFAAPGTLNCQVIAVGNSSAQLKSGDISLSGDLYVGGTIKGTNVSLTGSATLNGNNIDALPVNVIMLWYGDQNSMPKGWVLCDGGNGTPDLRDRFVVGAGGRYKKSDTGGNDSVTLAINNVPPHQHSISMHQRVFDPGNPGKDGLGLIPANQYTQEGTTDYLSNTNRDSADSFDIRPKYYGLFYIMKTG